MSAWLKPAAAALAALIAFGAGCRYSAAQADAEISALKEDYATRARALEEKYRESEALANAKLRAAWEERDIALAHASDLSADLHCGLAKKLLSSTSIHFPFGFSSTGSTV